MPLTWLQRWRDRTFEREVAGVRLTADDQAEPNAVLEVGGTLQLEPKMTDRSGFGPMKYHTAPTFAYESGDGAKATVHASSGLVTAVHTAASDTTVVITVTATTPDAAEFEDTLTVSISGTTPAAVVVTPATTTKAPLATQQLTTVVNNAAGTQIVGELVTYESSDEAIATVDAAGLITAVATGEATVTATSVTDPTLTDTCVVTVS